MTAHFIVQIALANTNSAFPDRVFGPFFSMDVVMAALDERASAKLEDDRLFIVSEEFNGLSVEDMQAFFGIPENTALRSSLQQQFSKIMAGENA